MPKTNISKKLAKHVFYLALLQTDQGRRITKKPQDKETQTFREFLADILLTMVKHEIYRHNIANRRLEKSNERK